MPEAPPADAIEIHPAAAADWPLLQRMLELYQHDLSDLWDQDLDSTGAYGYDLAPYACAAPGWQAYLARMGGRQAGFALVNPWVRLPDGDFWMDQFFVLKKYRRRGVASTLAREVFRRHPGRWQVGQMPTNHPAQAFWRVLVAQVSEGRWREVELTQGPWQGVVQCFRTEGLAG